MLLQEGTVVLVWDECKGLLGREPTYLGESWVGWGLKLLVTQCVCEVVMDCFVYDVAVGFYGLAYDCAEVFDEVDVGESCFFVDFA